MSADTQTIKDRIESIRNILVKKDFVDSLINQKNELTELKNANIAEPDGKTKNTFQWNLKVKFFQKFCQKMTKCFCMQKIWAGAPAYVTFSF